MNRLIGSFLCAMIMLALSSAVQAGVLFSDNFDDHSDWSPQQPAYGGAISSRDGNAIRACTGCPDGTAKYAAYRVARTGFSDGRVGRNTLNITGENARGGSGKAFNFYVEPLDASLAEDWTNDGLLVVALNGNYETIYMRYYIKFSDNWVWNDNGTSTIKMGHMQHTRPGGSYWSYFKDGDNWPAVVPGFAKEYASGTNFYWNGQAVFRMHIRKQSCYYPSDGYNNMPDDVANDFFRYGLSDSVTNCTLGSNCLTWEDILMDGEWHSIEYKLKGNSAKGVSDGEFLMYIDGHLAISKTNIPWADMGADASGTRACSDCGGRVVNPPSDFLGWNTVIIGGNANIQRFSNTSNTNVEQRYTIDDLVIATSYIGPDYVIGAPPAPPKGVSQ
ncbi:MAG: hypothetical protein GX654_15095 [Desulfatiglans sp.]|nr:hypothetical protein [Desulfatiglans sp.]